MARRILCAENLTASLFAMFVLLACAYFFYAATKGPYGLYEKGRIEVSETIKSRTLNNLIRERHHASNMARRMSDGYLDLDLLDEQARSVLGMMRDDEIIIR